MQVLCLGFVFRVDPLTDSGIGLKTGVLSLHAWRMDGFRAD